MVSQQYNHNLATNKVTLPTACPFSLVVDKIAQSLTNVNIWYLDDMIFGDSRDYVTDNCIYIVPALASISQAKSQLINMDCGDKQFVTAFLSINEVLNGV